jgi:Carboxypeptidase regulatory-like domain
MNRIHCLFLSVLLTSPLLAQTAVLRGQVTDESKAVIPGAKVTLTGPAGVVKTTAADNNGLYSFAALAPGSYAVQAAAPQLAMPQPAKIALKPGLQTLNLQLTVASIAEKVTVQENSGPAVSTDAASNASAVVLRGDDLLALSDDPNDLQADLQALAGPSAGPGGGAIFIDGFSGGELPAKESIREIRINQNPFSPEYDKLGYGRIEIFTKPGMDKYRASINYNLGTQAWNSRNPYSAQKAPFLLQEFEGNGGGPINKRASFTLDAQRNMVDNGSITNGVTVDPNLTIRPFSTVITTPGRFTRATPRIDYQLNDKNTLTFRYGFTHSDATDAGIGGFDLISRGYHNQFTNQTVQVSETAVLGTSINETRFQYYRAASQMIANSASPEIQVLGAFTGGGSQNGRSFDIQNSFELQNYTSTLHGGHSLKFGVRLRGQTDDSVAPQNFNGVVTFGGGALEPVLDANGNPVLDASGQPAVAPITSIERYRRTLLFEQLGLPAAQIRALGGGATQFSINAGRPELGVHQTDVGIFAGDEWRARPNLTLSLGLRYETQSNIHDWRDLAPRLALAWAPGHAAKNARAKTVLRAGFGMFYDRFTLANTLTAQRYNGIVQQQYVVTNPDFFPNLPSAAMLAGFQSTQTIQEVSAKLRAPYILQSAVTLERQLAANITLAMTYTNSHGVHMFRSEDINAPLPGTYNPNVQNSGVFPLGSPGPVQLMESSGVYNQNQLIANVNARLNAGFSLFGFYVLNHAMSNTDGIGTFPANPYNFKGEYGPAATDVRNRMTVGGSINFKWNVRVSPFVTVQSGPPFDITSGSDLYGTTQFNGRPGIATDPNKPGLIQTRYGLLDPNPSPGEPLLSRNFGRGPGQISVNLRVGKTIGFGSEHEGPRADARPGGGGGGGERGGGGLAPAAASGGGMGNLLGRPTTSHRYNLTLSMSVRNLLNHNNPGPIIGNITSPLFGAANQIAGAQNGEGFYETANNRRLEMQIRFSF